MPLYTQSMNAPPRDAGSRRICVMRDPRVYNRFLKQFRETHGIPMYHEQRKDLAPPQALRDAYTHPNPAIRLDWDGYVAWFMHDVLHPRRDALVQLAHDALAGSITLLCSEATPEHCHRRLLAKEMKRLVPKLETIVE